MAKRFKILIQLLQNHGTRDKLFSLPRAAGEVLHRSYSLGTGEGCATRVSGATGTGQTPNSAPSPPWLRLAPAAVCPLLLITWLENEKIINSLKFNRALFKKQGKGLDGKDSWWKSPGDCVFHLTADLPHKS